MEAIKARIIKAIEENLREWEFLSEARGTDYKTDTPESRLADQIFMKARAWQDARSSLMIEIRAMKSHILHLEDALRGDNLVNGSYFKTYSLHGQGRIAEAAARLEEIESDLANYFWIIDLDFEHRLAFFEAIRIVADEA